MSKSWNGYAEVDDWKTDRSVRRSHKRKSELEWKKAMTKVEQVEINTSVYVIINEWTDIAGRQSSELVGGKYFATEDDAWAALSLIAEGYDAELGNDETSLSFEEATVGLQSEEYYIEELIKG